jgi:hypothetical protein
LQSGNGGVVPTGAARTPYRVALGGQLQSTMNTLSGRFYRFDPQWTCWRLSLTVESTIQQLNSFATERVLQRLLPELLALRNSAMRQEEAFADEIGNVEPAYRASARNLLNYLSVRQHDIRDLRMDTADPGRLK